MLITSIRRPETPDAAATGRVDVATVNAQLKEGVAPETRCAIRVVVRGAFDVTNAVILPSNTPGTVQGDQNYTRLQKIRIPKKDCSR